MSVIIETTLGDITVDLFVKERPRTCLNFLKLCKTKYYNYCLFHSVQRNFVAQSGDPTGLGRGGESIFQTLYGDQARFFDAEVAPKIKHRNIGTLSMVNDGNGQHGSQFLITLGDNLDYLDGVHTVFGEVAEGVEVLTKINETFCDKDHRPYKDIRITHTVILDDPLDDPPGLTVPDRSPEPTKEQMQSFLRIGADEEVDDNKGLTEQEVTEKEEKTEADHRAQVLEIIGDLPDKDIKPPDNVLFVCKINPVTTDEDLEIIFSRFGKIVDCEIIRDYKTGESLQYAFIEFSTPEECEKAYLKMDNVLIDDRRIHVDFSQSVSKMDYRRNNNPKLNPDKNGTSKEKNQPGRSERQERRRSPEPKRRNRGSEDDSRHRHRHRVRNRSSSSDSEREKRKKHRKKHDSPSRKSKDHKSRTPPRSPRRRRRYSSDEEQECHSKRYHSPTSKHSERKKKRKHDRD